MKFYLKWRNDYDYIIQFKSYSKTSKYFEEKY